ncbi:hypothetical protein BMBphi_gp036 [Bacillus phage vB_BthS_BMBphi]|nr:hypothetical protein BMBphi_gp036 [Bacillus phage vB_BthS_BMBphi]
MDINAIKRYIASYEAGEIDREDLEYMIEEEVNNG